MIENIDIRRAAIGIYDEFKDVSRLVAAPGKEDSNYRDIRIVSPSGLPAEIGFMDGRNNRFDRDRYAINTWPETVRHLDHHLYVKQYPGEEKAVISEEDWDMYMEGIDNFPRVIDRREISGRDLHIMTQTLLVGSFVLATEHATAFRDFKSKVRYEKDSLTQTMEFGRQLVQEGNVVRAIDKEMLERYAQID